MSCFISEPTDSRALQRSGSSNRNPDAAPMKVHQFNRTMQELFRMALAAVFVLSILFGWFTWKEPGQ